MDSRKFFEKPLLYGTISIAIPLLGTIMIIPVSALAIPYGLFMGIKGIKSGDRKTKTLSIIGLILNIIYLVWTIFGVWIFGVNFGWW
jgi:hypothetical protein